MITGTKLRSLLTTLVWLIILLGPPFASNPLAPLLLSSSTTFTMSSPSDKQHAAFWEPAFLGGKLLSAAAWGIFYVVGPLFGKKGRVDGKFVLEKFDEFGRVFESDVRARR